MAVPASPERPFAAARSTVRGIPVTPIGSRGCGRSSAIGSLPLLIPKCPWPKCPRPKCVSRALLPIGSGWCSLPRCGGEAGLIFPVDPAPQARARARFPPAARLRIRLYFTVTVTIAVAASPPVAVQVIA